MCLHSSALSSLFFFKCPQDRCLAVRINTHLVHCAFLWWPQHAFAEMEALLTPFYGWKHGSTVLRPARQKHKEKTARKKTQVSSHQLNCSSACFKPTYWSVAPLPLPASHASAGLSFPPKPSLVVQCGQGGRKQGQHSKGYAEIESPYLFTLV